MLEDMRRDNKRWEAECISKEQCRECAGCTVEGTGNRDPAFYIARKLGGMELDKTFHK